MNKWFLTPDKYLKEAEVKHFLRFMEDQALLGQMKDKKKPIRDWAIIDTALSSGLRVEELSHLKIKHLYLGKGENSLLVEKGKGSKDGIVKIPDKLKKHLKKFIQWKKRAGEAYGPEAYLFTSERSPQMSRSAIQKRFKHWLEKSGLPDHYSIHSARHTYGTMLYRETKDIRLVQKQLRHRSCQTTVVYADVPDEDVERGVNLLYA